MVSTYLYNSCAWILVGLIDNNYNYVNNTVETRSTRGKIIKYTEYSPC